MGEEKKKSIYKSQKLKYFNPQNPEEEQILKSVLYFSLSISTQNPQWSLTWNTFLQKVTRSIPVQLFTDFPVC